MRAHTHALKAKRHKTILKSLSPAHLSPIAITHSQWRREYASLRASASEKPYRVGIVGGGMTGLSTAYYLYQMLGPTNSWSRRPLEITIYEANSKLGGWCNTQKKVLNKEGEYIRIEGGPRTLRCDPNNVDILKMMKTVGILDSARFVSKQHPAGRNRYIYMGDEELYRVPITPVELFADVALLPDGKLGPVFKHQLLNCLKVHRWKDYLEIKTLDEWLTSLFGEYFVKNFMSAFVHGIYAGNISKLDKSSHGPWDNIRKLYFPDGFTWAGTLLRPRQRLPTSTPVWPQTDFYKKGLPLEEHRNSFVYYIKEGFGYLVLALQSYLRMEMGDRVKIRTNTPVTAIKMHGEGNASGTISTAKDTQRYDQVITSCDFKTLEKILGLKSANLPPDSYASVATVTLYWKDSPIKYEGFGYVIPSTVTQAKNPHGALGVIFDSISCPEHNKVPPSSFKVTVMMGGAYWDDKVNNGEPLPSKEEVRAQAIETLQIQMGVTATPDFTHVQIMRDAIEQSTPAVLAARPASWWKGDIPLAPFATKNWGPGVPHAVTSGLDLARLAVSNLWLSTPRAEREIVKDKFLEHLEVLRRDKKIDLLNETWLTELWLADTIRTHSSSRRLAKVDGDEEAQEELGNELLFKDWQTVEKERGYLVTHNATEEPLAKRLEAWNAYLKAVKKRIVDI